ncbi:MAG: hypothetical protein ACXVPN_14385 [Bacteroidia bacterium]
MNEIQNAPDGIESSIKKAIKERMVIQFMHDQKREVIEPYLIGYTKNSKAPILLGYRIFSTHNERPWRMYPLKSISEVSVINLMAYSYRVGMRRYTGKFDIITTTSNRFSGYKKD